MTAATRITVIGTVGTPPKPHVFDSGERKCSFRIAVQSRFFDKHVNAWVDGDTSWFQVNAYRSLAEHAQESFTVGQRVIVTGKLRVRDWATETKSGTTAEIDADGLGHDLLFGVSAFEKRLTGRDRDAERPEAEATHGEGATMAA